MLRDRAVAQQAGSFSTLLGGRAAAHVDQPRLRRVRLGSHHELHRVVLEKVAGQFEVRTALGLAAVVVGAVRLPRFAGQMDVLVEQAGNQEAGGLGDLGRGRPRVDLRLFR